MVIQKRNNSIGLCRRYSVCLEVFNSPLWCSLGNTRLWNILICSSRLSLQCWFLSGVSSSLVPNANADWYDDLSQHLGIALHSIQKDICSYLRQLRQDVDAENTFEKLHVESVWEPRDGVNISCASEFCT